MITLFLGMSMPKLVLTSLSLPSLVSLSATMDLSRCGLAMEIKWLHSNSPKKPSYTKALHSSFNSSSIIIIISVEQRKREEEIKTLASTKPV